MCQPNAHVMAVSLNLNDTPVGYAPPKGPPVFVTFTYNQRDIQAASPNFFNVGPNWTHSFVSFIQDKPSDPAATLYRYEPGGGRVEYLTEAGAYDSGTGLYGAERQSGAVLKRIPASGSVTSYELTFPDGTKHVFGKVASGTSYPRRVFLTSITDPAGNALTLAYTATTPIKLTSITDATGRSTTFTYAHATDTKLVTGVTDPFGRTAAVAYCASGDSFCPVGSLKSITDVEGIVSSFQYDTGGGGDPKFIKKLTTPYGDTTFAKGENNTTHQRWLTITDPLGWTERVEFMPGATGVAASLPSGELPGSGVTTGDGTLNADNSFYWDKHAYADGGNNGTDYSKAVLTHWLSNSRGQPVSVPGMVRKPGENPVFYNYDGQPNAYQVGTRTQPSKIARVLPGSATQLRAFTYHSASGKVTQETDPVGRVTKYTYDASGIDLLKVEQKNGASSWAEIAEYTYPSSGNHHKPLTWEDAAGNTTTYAYNAAAQLTQITDQASRVTKFEYETGGGTYSRLRYVKRTIAGSDVTLAERIYPTTCGAGTANPNCDLPEQLVDSEGRTLDYEYDDLDRVTKVTYPDSSTELFGYTTLDLTSHTDRLGRSTSYSYNNNRFLSSVTEPVSSGVTRTTSYSYYRNGALNTLTDAQNNVTVWTVDLQGRVVGKNYAGPSGGFGQTYDSAGRPSVRTDGLWQTKTIGYNTDDSVASITYGNEVNATPDVSFAYDTYYPRVTSMTDGNGTTGFGYVDPHTGTSGAGLVLWENQPYSGDTIVYGYDAVNRMLSREVQETGGTVTESWGYDDLDRATSHGTALGDFVYAFNVRTAAPTTRSIMVSGTPSLLTTWSYDTNANDRRLTGITHNGNARDYTITANAVRISAISETASSPASWAARSWTVGYDDADRVTSAVSSSPSLNYTYAYDKADNFTSFTNTAASTTLSPSVNALNQQSGFGGTFSYDVEGNLTSTPSKTFKWDAENRLVEIDFVGISPSVQRVEFKYDGIGRRTHKLATVSSTTTETRYLWSGDTLLQARNSSNAVQRRYYPEGEHRPTSSERLYYAADHLDSVRDVVNLGTSAVVRTQDYSPYGAVQRSWGSVVPDYHYAGLLYEGLSGLQLSKTRLYDGFVGKWLNRDPIAETGGVNLYAYVDGRPFIAVDPSGLQAARPAPTPRTTTRVIPRMSINRDAVEMTGLVADLLESGLDHRAALKNTRRLLARNQAAQGDYLLDISELPDYARKYIEAKVDEDVAAEKQWREVACTVDDPWGKFSKAGGVKLLKAAPKTIRLMPD